MIYVKTISDDDFIWIHCQLAAPNVHFKHTKPGSASGCEGCEPISWYGTTAKGSRPRSCYCLRVWRLEVSLEHQRIYQRIAINPLYTWVIHDKLCMHVHALLRTSVQDKRIELVDTKGSDSVLRGCESSAKFFCCASNGHLLVSHCCNIYHYIGWPILNDALAVATRP